MDKLIEQLRAYLPPMFAGTELDKLTGKAIRWRTIQNRRANQSLPPEKKIPDECFIRSGNRKTIIVRDPFLDWWKSEISHNAA